MQDYDPMSDLINANRDELLAKHEEAVRRVLRCLRRGLADTGGARYVLERECKLANDVLAALHSFHPMHGESWQGWPEGSDK